MCMRRKPKKEQIEEREKRKTVRKDRETERQSRKGETERKREEEKQNTEKKGESPEKQIKAVMKFWLEDLSTPETTVFFPECWALSNHNSFVAELMDNLYSKAREPLNELIPQINPTLTQKESEQLALYMCASMEGLTMFAGFEKPWSTQLSSLKKMSIDNFMDIIKNTKGSKRV